MPAALRSPAFVRLSKGRLRLLLLCLSLLVLTSLSASAQLDGRMPRCRLVQVGSYFYGATWSGGANNLGALFRTDAAGVTTVLHSFAGTADGANPCGLMAGADGNLYGVAYAGGASGNGTVFKADTSGNVTVLYSFQGGTDGLRPFARLMQASDGFLYGSTTAGGSSGGYGTLFKISTTGTYTQLYSFNYTNGYAPYGTLLQNGTDFYGTTWVGGANNLGVAFKFSSSGAFTLLHTFAGGSTDGANPVAGLTLSNGNFYGTTYTGGSNNVGTIYRMTSAGAVTVLYSFAAATGSQPYSAPTLKNGVFYGTAAQGGTSGNGALYSFDPNTSTYTCLYSFSGPDGSTSQPDLLPGSDGNFYGTALNGGTYSFGTLFEMATTGTPATTTVTVLHHFGTPPAGNTPAAPLIQGSDGLLYGTTLSSTSGLPMAYKISNAGAYSPLYGFGPTDGANNYAPLLQASDGNFYSMAATGGTSAGGPGTAYKMTSSGVFTVLNAMPYDSTGASGTYPQGSNPYGGLVQIGSYFYGVGFRGGYYGYGTIFKMDTAGTMTRLYSFVGGATDGAYAYGGLVPAGDGYLYGTTWYGGTYGKGTIFRIKPDGTGYSCLFNFAGTNGYGPCDRLCLSGSDLYGVTYQGGTADKGTIFKYNTGGTFTSLASFTDGQGPTGGVIKGTDGNFYGTTQVGGSTGLGTIYRLNASTNVVTTLYTFSGPDGSKPASALLQASDGYFYGVTFYGGATNNGAIYKIGLIGTPTGLTTLHSFPASTVTGLTVSVSPASVVGGSSSTGTVTLTAPAPSNGISVALSSNSGNATVPNNVTIAGGAASATFPITTTSVATLTTATISATYENITATAPLTITPLLASLGLAPNPVVGGNNSTGTVTLSAPAPAGGVTVNLWRADIGVPSGVTVPSSVTVPANSTTATFTITTVAVNSPITTNIEAIYAGAEKDVVLTVNPPFTLTGFSLVPSGVTGGSTATGTVTLTPAPTVSAYVLLTSSNGAATVPYNVGIAANSTTATFTVNTTAVATDTAATITASLNGTSIPKAFTVYAPTLPVEYGLAISPSSVAGGADVTGTITLDGPAPAGGCAVTLAWTPTSAASIDGSSSITIPAGYRAVAFTIHTSEVNSPLTVNFTATYKGISAPATLKLNPSYLWATGVVIPNKLSLQWDVPAGAYNRYVLKRDGTTVATVPTSTTSFVDTFTPSIVSGQTYTYTLYNGYVDANNNLTLSDVMATEKVIPYKVDAAENQAVDSRLDLRQGANVFLDFPFGSRTYRGGLFAGYGNDPARVGRSFIKFSPPVTDMTSKIFRTGSVNAYSTGNYGSSASSVQIGCQPISDNTWNASTLVWSLAPPVDPANAVGKTTVTFDPTNTDPATNGSGWYGWSLSDPIYNALKNGTQLSVALTGANESSQGWTYFAKKEYDATKAPCLGYLLELPVPVAIIQTSYQAAGNGFMASFTVIMNGLGPNDSALVTVTVGGGHIPVDLLLSGMQPTQDVPMTGLSNHKFSFSLSYRIVPPGGGTGGIVSTGVTASCNGVTVSKTIGPP